jgi:hypothetical protein
MKRRVFIGHLKELGTPLHVSARTHGSGSLNDKTIYNKCSIIWSWLLQEIDTPRLGPANVSTELYASSIKTTWSRQL